MPVINSVAVPDRYEEAGGHGRAILAQVFNSRGGWFSVAGEAVFVQLQYGPQGDTYWTEEVEVGAGAFAYLDKSCAGVRFRNAVAGRAATVTAQIAQGQEPPLSIVALGTISVAGAVSVTQTIRSVPNVNGFAYTLPVGCTVILVECWGGGGAGGPAVPTGAGQVALGGGGAGGCYASRLIPVSSFSQPATLRTLVGSGGAAGSGAPTDGGASNFQETGPPGGVTWVQADGGAGGTTTAAPAAPPFIMGAGGRGHGALPNIGDLVIVGGAGAWGFAATLTNFLGGAGGEAARGSGRGPSNDTGASGYAGQSFGGGGNGGVNSAGQPVARVGTAGADGLVVITEFY